MPRFVPKGTKTSLLEQNWNISKISEQLEVSWHSVKNFVTKENKYGGQKKRERKPRMTPREKSIIIRCSSNSSITANQIKAQYNLAFAKSGIKKVR